MLKTVFLMGLAAALLGGCQSTSNSSGSRANNSVLDQLPAIDVLPDAGLEAQQLAPGECGLFLWSKTDLTKFIFFSKALSGQAIIAQANGQTQLQQTGAGGDIFGQFNTKMQYAAKRPNQIVELSLKAGELLEGGQRLESGMLTTEGADGWRTKLPVLGVRACQPAR